ncbi:unnamed protein product [Dovyalis caffra]|uniref:Apple domain-containing protein n=1 Tax=Dovyalis caffra TaxID=77055 RepID=A0AAV1SKJ8_9ROSI|nr:unnamed protein product [Dovyalis caffra]
MRRKVIVYTVKIENKVRVDPLKGCHHKRSGSDSWISKPKERLRSTDDPGIGDVSLRVNPNGSPQVFLYKGTKPSRRTAPWPWRSHGGGQPSPYNRSFVNAQDEIYVGYTIPDDSLVLITVVDYSGFLKKLTWQESESSDGQWKEIWREPQSRCDFYGWCGPNSLCEPADINRFECSCLLGFEPKCPRDWFLRDGCGGCVRKRLESSSVCEHGEGFVKVENVILPDTTAAVWVDMSMSRAECELECKTNCSCSAYASIEIPGQGDGCLTWYGELLDMKYGTTDSYDLFVRVDAYELAEYNRKSNGSGKRKDILAILAPSVASLWFLISLFAFLWLRKRAQKEARTLNLSVVSVHGNKLDRVGFFCLCWCSCVAYPGLQPTFYRWFHSIDLLPLMSSSTDSGKTKGKQVTDLDHNELEVDVELE